MTDLSPAAQAVRDAVLATYADNIPKDDNLWALERASTAAALRAAADRAQASVYSSVPSTDRGKGWKEGVRNTADELRAIAAELEA